MLLGHGGMSSGVYRPDTTIEPALKVIREHRDSARSELERIGAAISETQQEMESNAARLKSLRDQENQFTHELRAHERVLQQLTHGASAWNRA